MTGELVSHYKVLDKLGGGGMGVVYRAEDMRLRRIVALKFLPTQLSNDEAAKQRFVVEAKAASSLDHPNICNVHEIGETDTGQLFIAMAFYKGVTLKRRIKKAEGWLPISEALDIATQTACGLTEAHSVGIVHRDIKPANLMLAMQTGSTETNVIKILDFGLAKMGDANLTQSGAKLGTIAYMSPEQSRGDSIDHRTDIWSFGVVLYEMLTGTRPFCGDYDQAIIYSIMNEQPKPPSLFTPGLPPELEHIVGMCLSKDPDLRYSRMSRLLADLQAIKNESDRQGLFANKRTSPVQWFEPRTTNATVKAGRGRRMQNLGVALLISAALLVAVFATLKNWFDPTRIESMAVLPCSGDSGDTRVDYVCDLFGESLTASMSQIPGLMVKSSQVVGSFRGSELSVLDIGKELGVSAVMTMNVGQQSGGLDLTVEVTDVRNGAHIWGHRFENPTGELQRLHEAISLDVAEQLHHRLSGLEEAQLRVYATYQQALYYWNQRTKEGIEEAINLFERVIREDPTFARAHAGLANSHVLLPYYGGVSPASAYPMARRAAQEALRLDESQADAHASLGLVKRDYEHDWLGAETEFRRAIQLDPMSGSAHQWYAELLAMTGRFEAAESHIREAQRVSPLSLSVRAVHGWILMCAGRLEDAHLQFMATLERDPDFPMAHWFVGQLYVLESKYDLAITHLQEAVRLDEGTSRYLADLGSAYALRGDRERAQAILAELGGLSDRGVHVSRYEHAVVHAGLGDRDGAIEELEAALEERTWQVINMRIDPMLRPVRTDQRYRGLIRRVGLPDLGPIS